MAVDPFATVFRGASDPSDDVIPVTPDANNDLPAVCNAIRANAAGTVTVWTVKGGQANPRVLNFTAGETRALRATRIVAATATGLEIHV